MRTYLCSLAVSILAACSGPVPGTCVLGGVTHRAGETFPSLDGCNTCSCLADGSIACTERACLSTDAFSDDGGRDAGGDAGADVVMCTGGSPSFPAFDKRCAAAGDCEIGLHQINCCGSQKALGISKTEHERFKKDEDICRGQYPGCGCAAQPTVAEDGKTSQTGSDIGVDCKAGACTTFIR